MLSITAPAYPQSAPAHFNYCERIFYGREPGLVFCLRVTMVFLGCRLFHFIYSIFLHMGYVQVDSAASFQWQCQLRHRWDEKEKDCFINICDAQFRWTDESVFNSLIGLFHFRPFIILISSTGFQILPRILGQHPAFSGHPSHRQMLHHAHSGINGAMIN